MIQHPAGSSDPPPAPPVPDDPNPNPIPDKPDPKPAPDPPSPGEPPIRDPKPPNPQW